MDLETQISNLDGGYEKLTTTISKQGEQWHREINAIINKMKTEISEIKVKHRDTLQKHLDEIKQIQTLIKQTLIALNEIEKSTAVAPTIEYNSKIREFSKLPPKLQVKLPTYIPKPIDREKLYSLFRHITPLSTATEENVLSLNQPNTSVRELLDKPELVATIQTGYEQLFGVTCLDEDGVWTHSLTNKIKCFNIKGSLLQTIGTESGQRPNDIVVNSDGDLLYSDWETTTVNKVKNGQTEELITLPEEWTPAQLCVTSTGDLLVTMFSTDRSKVVRYSGSTVKQTIQFDNKGKPLYSRNSAVKYITENRNHDICVADNSAGAVVVVYQDGKLRWRYTGHPSVAKNKSFEPYGITSDSQSRILTADRDNHCIHILDQNGRFLRYFDNCDLEDPYGLCVDNNDNLQIMDPLSTAQDVHRCDLCETAILASLDGGYEKLTTEISKQGEQWHREIDIVIDKMKTEINEIKVKHRVILQKHLDEIKQIQSLIKQTLLALYEIEKSTAVAPTIEYNSKIREFSKLPPKLQVKLPTFIPKPIDREKLYSLFGQITPLSTATEENVLSLNKPNTLVRELLDEPELVATIQTGYEQLLGVTCLDEDSVWTHGMTNKIKCFNIKGSLLQTIGTKSGQSPHDIAVNSDGDLLYSDWLTRTVNKVKSGQIEELIRLQGWKPNQLCVTSTGDLLVTMYSDDYPQSKVVRYSGSTEKQTIQFDDKGKPLYSGNSYKKYVTENGNHDICVADYGAGAVVVVNQDGKLRWRYTGHPSVTKKKPFEPWGITTDSQGHILTADCYNHCIHILDQNGQFLRYIDNCDLEYPTGLCVDNNDNLFVSEYNKGNVKKIKYLRLTPNW
uniref:Tripartite motif-containing protein 3 n=1 Tax=Magallana gigas TaxID=29159 RepID=K1QFB4_MAGGI